MNILLNRLRTIDPVGRAGAGPSAEGAALLGEFAGSGVGFAASPGVLEDVYYAAVGKLADCVRTSVIGRPLLQEGGIYSGCWLESTGTINAELLSRFCPDVAGSTIEHFAELRRDDGLLPYKVTGDGAVFKQIQLVTPPARSAWNHYRLQGGRDRRFLLKMYEALASYDEWLLRHRNTRGTGCVEAFCAFDTGHDLSPRFWHMPDTPYLDDPARCDPHSPMLPLLAPDLTASVYCSRLYLARMARELELAEQAAEWRRKAETARQALYKHCFSEEDGFFYDVNAAGSFNRIQSDVLLRVLACEAGDDALFAASLARYLLNSRKFFAKYPFASVAMDDPRFDPFSGYNTWGGAVNFLSLIRAPHAFEKHGRHVELTWIMQPIVSAMSRMTRFAQCLSPWTGEEGFTECYSPAILCVLDYIERLCGIMPTPDGELAFTGLLPQTRDHGVKLADETAYSRVVDGVRFELHNTREDCSVLRNGELLCRFPAGVRIVTDRSGKLLRVVGMTSRTAEGVLRYRGRELPLRIAGNEVLAVAAEDEQEGQNKQGAQVRKDRTDRRSGQDGQYRQEQQAEQERPDWQGGQDRKDGQIERGQHNQHNGQDRQAGLDQRNQHNGQDRQAGLDQLDKLDQEDRQADQTDGQKSSTAFSLRTISSPGIVYPVL